MLKLFKYEMRKTLVCKLVVFGLFVLLQAAFMIGLWTNQDRLLSVGVIGLVLTAACSVVVMGLQSLVTLHHDMNTRQGYMLFMTPHTGYGILGAKVLECCLSMALATAVSFGLGAWDMDLLFGHKESLQQMYDLLQQMMKSLGQEVPMNVYGIGALCLNLLAGWVMMIVTASLADIVASALLRGRKLSGLITFVLFILLTVLLNELVARVVPGALTVNTMLLQAAVQLGLSVVMYVSAATIMDRRLSV